MVKRILVQLTKEISGLHQAAYLLAFFTFISQLLGLVRDRLLAHHFGAGSTLDIYYAAFRIPDLLLVGGASIVSISVLVPFLTQRLAQGKQRAREFIDSVFVVFSLVIIAAALVVYALLPDILPRVFPGLSGPEALPRLVKLTRILLLSPILLGLSNLAASIVQVHKRFFVYALSPILYNVGIIVGILFLYPIWGIAGLGAGVVLGALLHLGIQVPVVIQTGLTPRIGGGINFRSVWEVFLTSLPRSLTLSVTHLIMFGLVALASLIGNGSITVLNFSFNLQSVPMALVGVSYSLAAFPTLSRLFSEGETNKFFSHITTAARHVIFWALPATILFIVLRAQIVRVVLGTGQFGWQATRLTAAALALFAVSVLAQSLVLLFVRGYYAAGKTWKPLWAATLSAFAAIAGGYGLLELFYAMPTLRYFLESLMRVDGLSGTAVLVLPLAYSLGFWINALLLWWGFAKDFSGFGRTLRRVFGQSFSASVIMGFVAYHGLIVSALIFNTQTLIGIFLQGLSAAVVGVVAWGVVLKLLGSDELAEMYRTLKRKLWRVNITLPEKEEL